jgi:beta-glucanase (GH16 family)
VEERNVRLNDCRMVRASWLVAVTLPLISAAPPAVKPRELDLAQFRLVWQDEFDGERLDTSRWQAPAVPRQGASRWDPSQVSVRDGVLRLGIRKTDDPELRYACGAVRTRRDHDPAQALFQQRYGYFEARCRLPRHLDADYWAAFWMMGGRLADDTPDSRDGLEMDIMESFTYGRTPPEPVLAFHWNGYHKLHNEAIFKCGPHPEVRDGKFHTFGLYWDEKVYVGYLDGVEIARTDLVGLGSAGGGKRKSNGPCRQFAYLKLTCEAAPWAGKSPEWEQTMPD